MKKKRQESRQSKVSNSSRKTKNASNNNTKSCNEKSSDIGFSSCNNNTKSE